MDLEEDQDCGFVFLHKKPSNSFKGSAADAPPTRDRTPAKTLAKPLAAAIEECKENSQPNTFQSAEVPVADGSPLAGPQVLEHRRKSKRRSSISMKLRQSTFHRITGILS
jgi:hypothetical protein